MKIEEWRPGPGESEALARAIYTTRQVQPQIPMALYRAVAQVLTYVL